MCENNLKIYEVENYKLSNCDYLKSKFEGEIQVVFLSPPWGGINY